MKRGSTPQQGATVEMFRKRLVQRLKGKLCKIALGNFPTLITHVNTGTWFMHTKPDRWTSLLSCTQCHRWETGEMCFLVLKSILPVGFITWLIWALGLSHTWEFDGFAVQWVHSRSNPFLASHYLFSIWKWIITAPKTIGQKLFFPAKWLGIQTTSGCWSIREIPLAVQPVRN